MNKENNIKIVSSSIEGFTALQKELEKLSDRVKEQVESIEYGFGGPNLKLGKKYKKERTIICPYGVWQIKPFDSNIIVYGEGFTLEIPLEETTVYSYLIEKDK